MPSLVLTSVSLIPLRFSRTYQPGAAGLVAAAEGTGCEERGRHFRFGVGFFVFCCVFVHCCSRLASSKPCWLSLKVAFGVMSVPRVVLSGGTPQRVLV